MIFPFLLHCYRLDSRGWASLISPSDNMSVLEVSSSTLEKFLVRLFSKTQDTKKGTILTNVEYALGFDLESLCKAVFRKDVPW